MQRQRARDADALALASAEGVGEPPHVLRAQPDPGQQIGHLLLALPAARHGGHQPRLSRRRGAWRGPREDAPPRSTAEPFATRIWICPWVGSMARSTQRAVVVLPQ